MITVTAIQAEIENTERSLTQLRAEIGQSDARLAALRTLLATMPAVADVQPELEPCMEALTLDQSEGEPEQALTLAKPEAPLPPPSLFGFDPGFSFETDSPNAEWRWLTPIQHLAYQNTRIRAVLDRMAADPTTIWSPVKIAAEMDMTQDKASHALSDLYKHGLVMRRKVGRLHHYKYRCLVTDSRPDMDTTPSSAT